MVAVQEVSSDMKGLEKLMSLLKLNWDYFVTDSTEGTAGGGERMAFLYDKSKIKFKNLAGEIVLPVTKLIATFRTRLKVVPCNGEDYNLNCVNGELIMYN